ncbi:hypothetical protein E0Z10_g7206 [Xylaria hypoxylon]|uniref:Clr5 domain-containing protein n=1 Tax=Xylaria hypoxylon TaxID=37992 RepID=A0A4Z0YQY7_9PEZI|nr:hypothetical protein E0Z10_g7206 [Xylaria hypoxylon]
MASDDWEQHKLRIVLMYSIERQSLQHIVSYMKEHHNFDKKPNQYEYRLKTWGIKKNAPKDVWPYVAHRIQKRKQKGKRSKVMLYGVAVPEERLRKETQRCTNIPTALEFGTRLPSPRAPEGEIVHIRSPSVIEFDYLWPETLPWFQFEHNVLSILQQRSDLLNVVLTASGSNTTGLRYPKYESFLSLFSMSEDAFMLRKAVLRYSKLIPKNYRDGNQETKALMSTQDSSSIAIDMLKVIFFRLSNNIYQFPNPDARHPHDQFVLQLVNTLSHSNPEIMSSLLSDRCRTSNAIKEAIYKSAIREKSYAIAARLLESGVNPNMPVQFDYTRYYDLQRGQMQIGLTCHKAAPRGIEIAAITTDNHLCEILLRAGANANTSSEDDPSPLALIGFDRKAKFDDTLKFAHLLIKYGAKVNPPNTLCQHGNAKEFSPLEAAIARQDNLLADFLIEQAANKILYDYSQLFCECQIGQRQWSSSLSPSGRRCSPLLIAIVSDNNEMTERLLQPILSQPTQVSLSFIRDLFITSCLAGDSTTVSKLLPSLDIDLDENWVDGITPLVATAWNPDVTIAKMLLMVGANIGPKQRGKSRERDVQISVPTPIHVAAFYGNTELVQILIDRGASCNVRYTLPKEGYGHDVFFHLPRGLLSPLHLALRRKNIETVTLLLPHSEITGDELAQAINLGNQTIILELLARGADVLFTSPDGTTVLEAAVENNNIEIVNLFFTSGGKYRSPALYKATKLAVKSEDHFLVKMLTDCRPAGPIDSHEASCLVLALQVSEWDLADHLLSSFAPGPSQSFYSYNSRNFSVHIYNDPDHRGYGTTPPLWAAYLSNNVHIIKKMIQQGYAFQNDDKKSFGESLSHNSKRLNSTRALFLSMGQPESMNLIGRQMLIFCAIKSCDIQRTREYIKFVDSLEFSTGLNDHWRQTPLALAVTMNHSELVNELIDAGANVEYRSNRNSPLQLAAQFGYVEMANLLMDRGANVNRPAHFRFGATALQESIIYGHIGLAKIFIERGADINALPAKDNGRTALEGAAEHGRLDSVQLLLEMGANLRDKMRIYYVRSVWFAASEGHYAIADFLKEYGRWTKEDQVLYDQLGTLHESHFRYDQESNHWHIRHMRQRNSDAYSIGSSGESVSVEDSTSNDASDEAEDVIDGSYERSALYRESEQATEDWLRSVVDTFDESANFDVMQEEEASNHLALPLRVSNRVITEQNSPQQVDENEESATVESVEFDWEQELSGHQDNAESEHTAGEQQYRASGEQESDLQASLVPEIVNEQAITTSMGFIPWGDPFFGADELENVWDI